MSAISLRVFDIDLWAQAYHTWCIHRTDLVHSSIQGLHDSFNVMWYPAHPLHSMISREWVPSCLAVLLRCVRLLRYSTCYETDVRCIVMAGLVNAFIPFSKTMDLVFAIGGCFLFSGYIVYDTYMINAKLSPDEFIMGAISLYLECVNPCELILFTNHILFLLALSTSVSTYLSKA